MDDLKYWVWLSSLPGVGARRFRLLVEHFGSPYGVWCADRYQLVKLKVYDKLVSAIVDRKYRDGIDANMHKMESQGIKVFRITDKSYPEALKATDDPPPVLYLRGDFKYPHDNRTIAIVGSRRATEYGRSMAGELAYELAARGITIVSGMARGVDTCAHRGALEANGRTIAVLGCGVDIPYPPENRKIIGEAIKSGAVVSEFPAGMKPLSGNFPARNRIISGLSMGVVVIEAGERSGALITVDFALEQGREVFAVPGNAKSRESKGTNGLIKQGAKTVTCVEDILEEFPQFKAFGGGEGMTGGIEEYGSLDSEERRVVENLDTEPTHIDVVLRKTGYDISKLNTITTMLELKGILRQLPGKFFIRT